jgi:uncharacterized RDD family membrane protein YckC
METNTPLSPAATSGASSAYAGFWLRFVAVIIDGILIGIVTSILASIFGWHIGSNPQYDSMNGILSLLYYVLMESSAKQATLGKMAMGIKVTDMSGNRIDWIKALIRYICKFISAIILMIGFIMAGFTEKKQGLHDIIAGTLVVRK